MDNGKIIEEGTPSELIRKHAGEEVLEVANDEEVLNFLKKAFPDARLEVVGDRIQVFTNKPRGVFTEILSKFSFKAAMIRDANLEDVFLKLTGRRLRE
jgi:lipooligosaccharide transport system ATP-binding protein